MANLHILDVGHRMYGDAILVHSDKHTILIDGAHPSDADLLAKQIRAIVGTPPPFRIDLLVVTHCHADHIGCLPALIKNGTLQVKKALVADETLAFGALQDSFENQDARRLFAALREEPVLSASETEIEAFIEDAVSIESQYRTMLAMIEQQNAPVIRFVGQDPGSRVFRPPA